MNKELTELQLLEAKADIERFKVWGGEQLLNRFLNVQPRLKGQYRDMTYWTSKRNPKDPDDLEDMVSELEDATQAKKDANRKAQEGAELIFDSPQWGVYHIKTLEASQKYGRSTKWCITSTDKNLCGETPFDSYTKKGIEFYYYIEKGTDNKYTLSLYDDKVRYELHDASNDKIEFIPNAPRIKGLPDVSRPSENNVMYQASFVMVNRPHIYTSMGREVETTLTNFSRAIQTDIGVSVNRTAVVEELFERRDGTIFMIKLQFSQSPDEFPELTRFTPYLFTGNMGGPLITQWNDGYALVLFENQAEATEWANINLRDAVVQYVNEDIENGDPLVLFTPEGLGVYGRIPTASGIPFDDEPLPI